MYALGGTVASRFSVNDQNFIRRAPLVPTEEKNQCSENNENESDYTN
jgi:hypothetical protein